MERSKGSRNLSALSDSKELSPERNAVGGINLDSTDPVVVSLKRDQERIDACVHVLEETLERKDDTWNRWKDAAMNTKEKNLQQCKLDIDESVKNLVDLMVSERFFRDIFGDTSLKECPKEAQNFWIHSFGMKLGDVELDALAIKYFAYLQQAHWEGKKARLSLEVLQAILSNFFGKQAFLRCFDRFESQLSIPYRFMNLRLSSRSLDPSREAFSR
jgi:hypothetical protein